MFCFVLLIGKRAAWHVVDEHRGVTTNKISKYDNAPHKIPFSIFEKKCKTNTRTTMGKRKERRKLKEWAAFVLS